MTVLFSLLIEAKVTGDLKGKNPCASLILS